jgi:protein-S-isoprenylcysteine O-methyltransferase Ste14
MVTVEFPRKLRPENEFSDRADAPAVRPRSATAMPTAWTGLAASIATIVLLKDAAWALHLKTLAVVGAAAAPMIVLDLGCFRTFRNPESGLAQATINSWSPNRIVRKLIGFAATLAALAAAYAVLPEYAGSFYDPVRQAAWFCLPWLLIAAPLYIAYVDRRQNDPEDAYAQLGGLLTAQSVPTDWSILGQHARGWLVKGFFLPLMFVYLSGNLAVLWRADIAALLADYGLFYEFSINALYLFDLLFAVIGYVFTLRLLDTHIRSTEPTMTGWVVCLVCYQPFWSLFHGQYLSYDRDDYYWGDLTMGYPLVHAMWGTAILACLFIYTWSTVVFGLRFSNLTHRGVITSGPYRWTRHPAYVSKCASFWLISIPFLSNAGWKAAATQTLLLLAGNGIYLARAITEERHLGRDPVYRAYQDYIRENGLLPRLRRLMRGHARGRTAVAESTSERLS